MSFQITTAMLNASLSTSLLPNIVLTIEGFDELFSSAQTSTPVAYGDADTEYGDPIVYGGLKEVDNNFQYISFDLGTSTTIKQQLNPEKGTSDSISSMRIAMIDNNGELTSLFAPDTTVSPVKDILGRSCKVLFGFSDTSYPEDYITIFRGKIDGFQQGAGLVALTINSPESKKKGEIISPSETELSSSMSGGATVANVNDATSFLDPGFVGANGIIDPDLQYGLQIDNEIMLYTAKSAAQFSGINRGQFGTTDVAHDIDSSVASIYVLSGNALDLALKLMLSGVSGTYIDSIDITSFVMHGVGSTANTIFIEKGRFENDFGLTVGDYVTSVGASNPSNVFSNKPVTAITAVDGGEYITISGVTLVLESPTTATLSIRSRYDVFPVGAEMNPDEVDITQHNFIKNTFLSGTSHYRFLLRSEIELKSFLGEQIYNPLGAYSVPRKARSSVGYHLAGLLPGGDKIRNISTTNVVGANKLSIIRTTNKNFFNAVLYKFDERVLEEDKFEKINGSLSADSRDRIDTGSRTLLIESKGLRTDLQAESLANAASSRRLDKYQFGAEYIKTLQLDLKTGFSLEVGDVVNVKMTSLKLSDKNTGTRAGVDRLFAIDNKTFNFKSGKVTVDLVDTNFSQTNRYCLIGPSSFVSSGISQTAFIIEPSFNTSKFGANEFQKWIGLDGNDVKVHSSDFTTVGTSELDPVLSNTITVVGLLGFTPSNGQLLNFNTYPNMIASATNIYCFMRDSAFADGTQQYKML